MGESLFVIKMRRVVDDLNSGRHTLVEAAGGGRWWRRYRRWPSRSADEFSIEEYGALIDAIALSIEQGAPLGATLGDMSNSLQSEVEPEIEPEIENELLGRGLRTATPMALGTGIAITLINIGQISPAVYFYHDKTHSPLPAPVHRGFVLADSVWILDELTAFDFVQFLPMQREAKRLLRSVNTFDEKVGPVAAHVARYRRVHWSACSASGLYVTMLATRPSRFLRNDTCRCPFIHHDAGFEKPAASVRQRERKLALGQYP